MFRLWTLLVGLPLCAAVAREAGPAALAPDVGAAAAPATGSGLSSTTLSGVLQWRGLPPLRWSIETAAGATPSTRVAGKARITADGLSASADVAVDASTGEVAWRDGTLRLELGRWIPWLLDAVRLSPLPAGVTVTGELTGTTAGAWTARGLSGQADLQVRGDLERITPPLRVDGITLSLALPNLRDLGDSPLQLARFSRARVGDLIAQNAEIRFRVRGLRDVRVEGAEVDLLGGRVRVDPFPIRIEPEGLAPVAATVSLERIALEEVIRLLPNAVTAATGSVSGAVAVEWSRERSLTIGRGALNLSRHEPSQMRLAPQPGFLTSQLPQRLTLLSPSFGPIARWFSPPNPAYAAVEAIELGRVPLIVESLEVTTRPEADADGRTARLQVRARPATPGAVGEVSFEINLFGPLNQVLKLGLDERVRLPGTARP